MTVITVRDGGAYAPVVEDKLYSLPIAPQSTKRDALARLLKRSGGSEQRFDGWLFHRNGQACLVVQDSLRGEPSIYTVLDLHALPGWQNHHWHSDNPTNQALLWQHPHFQDRVVHLWEVFARRYRDNPWVAGYNPINEPADESRAVVGPFYARLVEAIRAVDPRHTLFLDGNTYSTEFDIFDDEPTDNTVYVCHDYVAAGLGREGGGYPGRAAIERKFLARSDYARRTGTPIWVGEFGPIYTGDYWVLDHGDDYDWSIVGEPSGRYLWLLARDPKPDPALLQTLLARVEALGYDRWALRITQQG